MRRTTPRIVTALALGLLALGDPSPASIVSAIGFAPSASVTPGESLAGNFPSQGGLYDTQTGFRIKHYRSATPDDVPGGKRIDIGAVDDLLAEGNAVLLDVMPSTGASFSPRTGKWRLSQKHDNIPGSVWLPDVGLGTIPPELQRFLAGNLERITGGDLSRPLIVYCQSDCWMAWNAVQRIAGLGYRTIYWYPDGIDGWRDFDRELVPAIPTPVAPAYLSGDDATPAATSH
jgi:PQQ-dependent catabolism-associated CXXCW motif protein